MGEWNELTDWWLSEIDEPAYAEEVLPLFLGILAVTPDETLLDLGCGEGRIQAEVVALGVHVIGVDINLELARVAARNQPVVVHRLPDLSCFKDASVDGGYVVLALEHIHDSQRFFAETARVVRPGGRLSIVINHPVYTAPNSGPILDQSDGELFWRFGDYLSPGSTQEPAGHEEVEFVHRPVGMLLTEAARAGWSLEEVAEQGVGSSAAARDPLLAKHREIPHLMALRWRRASFPPGEGGRRR